MTNWETLKELLENLLRRYCGRSDLVLSVDYDSSCQITTNSNDIVQHHVIASWKIFNTPVRWKLIAPKGENETLKRFLRRDRATFEMLFEYVSLASSVILHSPKEFISKADELLQSLDNLESLLEDLISKLDVPTNYDPSVKVGDLLGKLRELTGESFLFLFDEDNRSLLSEQAELPLETLFPKNGLVTYDYPTLLSRLRRPIYIDIGSLIPLTLGEKLVGVILCERWLPWQVLYSLQRRFSTILSVKGITRRLKRLSDELLLKANDNLIKLVKALGASLNMPTLLGIIADLTRDLLEARGAAVFLRGIYSDTIWAAKPEDVPVLAVALYDVLNQKLSDSSLNQVRYTTLTSQDIEVIKINNVDNVKYSVTIPIKSKARTLSGLIVTFHDRQPTLNSTKLDLLKALSGSVYLAVENNYLIESILRKNQLLEILFRFSREIIGYLDFDRLVNFVLTKFTEVMDTDKAIYLSFIPETVTFKPYMYKGLNEPLHEYIGELSLALSDIEPELVSKLARGEPIVLGENSQSLLSETLFSFFSLLMPGPHLIIPITMDSRLLGMICLQKGTVLEDDIQLARSMAVITANAIIRSKLWQELDWGFKVTHALNELSRIVTQQLSYSEALDRAVHILHELIPTALHAIYTFVDGKLKLVSWYGSERTFRIIENTLHRNFLVSLKEGRKIYLDSLMYYVDDPIALKALQDTQIRCIILVPLITTSNQKLGLLVSAKLSDQLTDSQQEAVERFARNLVTVLENLKVRENLISSLNSLASIYSLIKELAQERDEHEFLKKTLELLYRYFSADTGAALKLQYDRMHLVAYKGGLKPVRSFHLKIMPVSPYTFTEVSELSDTIPWKTQLLREGYKRILIIPIGKEELMGIVALGFKQRERLTEREQRFILTLQPLLSIMLRTLRILSFETTTAEVLRKNLLPRAWEISQKLSQTYPIDLAIKFMSARELTADYMDFIKISDRKLLFVISDVSGKGANSAIYTVQVKFALTALSSLTDDLREIASSLNDLLIEVTPPETFMTMFIGLIDFEREELRYINSGHEPPLLIRGDTITELRASEYYLPLGIEKQSYEEEKVKLRTGDLIIIYSDGITEAMSPSGEEFGIERLKDIGLKSRDLPARRIATKVYVEVKRFTRSPYFRDDFSLAIIKLVS